MPTGFSSHDGGHEVERASRTRQRQLALIHAESDRDLFILDELNEIDEEIRGRFSKMEQGVITAINEVRDECRERDANMVAELRERDDKTNRRITTMQGVLIGAMSTTTVAAVVGGLNLLLH